jgi:hypothetical protein
MLAGVTTAARCTFDELAATGWVDKGHELPAPWVARHIERMGGWRLAPRLLVEQLARLREPAPLVLTPRRQMRRLNAQFDFGDPATRRSILTTQPRGPSTGCW